MIWLRGSLGTDNIEENLMRVMFLKLIVNYNHQIFAAPLTGVHYYEPRR